MSTDRRPRLMVLLVAALAGFAATGGVHGLRAFGHSWWIHPEHRPAVRLHLWPRPRSGVP